MGLINKARWDPPIREDVPNVALGLEHICVLPGVIGTETECVTASNLVLPPKVLCSKLVPTESFIGFLFFARFNTCFGPLLSNILGALFPRVSGNFLVAFECFSRRTCSSLFDKHVDYFYLLFYESGGLA